MSETPLGFDIWKLEPQSCRAAALEGEKQNKTGKKKEDWWVVRPRLDVQRL